MAEVCMLHAIWMFLSRLFHGANTGRSFVLMLRFLPLGHSTKTADVRMRRDNLNMRGSGRNPQNSNMEEWKALYVSQPDNHFQLIT
jgi:hypothetical protein